MTITAARERSAERAGQHPDPITTHLAGRDPGRRDLVALDRARLVLESARGVVERGWLQHGWYLAPTPPRSLGSRLRAPHSPTVAEIEPACLVAAISVAAHRGGSRPDPIADAGPVIDIVWDALQDRPGPGVAGRAAPQQVRVERMRDLVRWNDTAGRTRHDVLHLLDRAIDRTIMTAMSPAGAGRRAG